MKVFLPIATTQNLIIRPRANTATVDLSIRNEFTDTTTTTTGIATTFSDGYLTVPFSHPFNEAETFEMEVTNNAGGALVWRGKCFATAQTPQDYKMNV